MDQDHGHPVTPRPRTRWPIRVAAVVVPVASYGVPLAVFAKFAHDPNWADFWKTAATPYGTMTAGFAAIAAAWIAYANGQAQRGTDRDTAHQELTHAQQQLAATTADADRKHDAEIVRDLRARFTTATQQLADPTHTIQQAGAYALASLADDWLQRNNTQEAQVCINVLCTYLRTHHLGDNHPPEPPADQPVRDTVVRIVAEHLQEDRDYAWSTLDFDFAGARFHNSNFSEVKFAGRKTSFRGAQFTGEDTLFHRAQFAGEYTSFDEANFTEGRVWFDAVKFKNTSFQAQFRCDAWFNAAQFTGEHTSFAGAEFTGEHVWFGAAEFTAKHTWFDGAQFTGEFTWFGGAKFSSERTGFDWANFTGGRAWFDGAEFTEGCASFDSAKFNGRHTSFDRVQFAGERISFDKAQFAGERTSFDKAQFGSPAVVVFTNPAAWKNVRFDWDDDPSQQPENVLPANWPPQVVEADKPDTA